MGVGDDSNPEAEDVHSFGIEDCEPTRVASLQFCRLRASQFEKEQAWLEEDKAQVQLNVYVMLRLTQAFRS